MGQMLANDPIEMKYGKKKKTKNLNDTVTICYYRLLSNTLCYYTIYIQ